MFRIILLLALSLVASVSVAGSFPYSQAIISYADSEIDSLDGSGFDFNLSYDLNRILLNLHVQKIDYDIPSGDELYTEYHTLGVGSYLALSEMSDVFGYIKLGQYDSGINPAGAKLASTDVFEMNLGLRQWLNNQFEGQLYAGMIDFDQDVEDQSFLGARIIYYVSANRTMGLSFAYESYDDFDHALFSAVFSF